MEKSEERRSDRLILKSDLRKTLRAGDLLQGILRPPVRPRVIIDEAHRPTEHHLGDLAIRSCVGRFLQTPEDQAYNVFESVGLRLDARGLVHQRRAENGLQTTHEAPVRALHISLHRGPTEHSRPVGKVEEDRTGECPALALEARQFDPRHSRDRDRGIGRAKIQAAKHLCFHPNFFFRLGERGSGSARLSPGRLRLSQ